MLHSAGYRPSDHRRNIRQNDRFRPKEYCEYKLGRYAACLRQQVRLLDKHRVCERSRRHGGLQYSLLRVQLQFQFGHDSH